MFGCGEPSASRALSGPDAAAQRLLQTETLKQATLDQILHARSRTAWPLVLMGGALGLIGAVGATLTNLTRPTADGRVHTLPSDARTVRLGIFDSTLPNLLEI